MSQVPLIVLVARRTRSPQPCWSYRDWKWDVGRAEFLLRLKENAFVAFSRRLPGALGDSEGKESACYVEEQCLVPMFGR